METLELNNDIFIALGCFFTNREVHDIRYCLKVDDNKYWIIKLNCGFGFKNEDGSVMRTGQVEFEAFSEDGVEFSEVWRGYV